MRLFFGNEKNSNMRAIPLFTKFDIQIRSSIRVFFTKKHLKGIKLD